MSRFYISKRVLFLALCIALSFSLISIFVLSPAIKDIFIRESTDEAFRLGEHIAGSLDLNLNRLSEQTFNRTVAEDLANIKKQFHLYKMNIFGLNEAIIYSTNDSEIGLALHDNPVFRSLQKGNTYSSFVEKGNVSLEGVPLNAHVIEAYIPVMRNGKFLGAIDIYYDITDAWEDFSKFNILFSSIIFIIAFILLSMITVYSSRIEEGKRRQKKVESDLMMEQIKSEAIFSAMGDNVIIQDRNYDIIYQNEVNRNGFGDHLGEKCYKVYEGLDHICDDCPVEVTYKDGKVHRLEKGVKTKYGIRQFELTSAPLKNEEGDIVAGIKVVRDITERKNLEEQLRHAQKVEALGTLTSGISHEFNNILTTMHGFAEMMREELENEHPLRKYVDIILQSTERASYLTRGLLVYSRKQSADLHPIQVGRFLEQQREFIAKLIGVDITLSMQISDISTAVLADANQLQQVLLNLAANARDAMPDGGTLTIRTKPYMMDDTFINEYGFGKAGEYVCITVEDNGQGMSAETIEKIFEPFYTTKEVGKGTGLGLAIAYGIVKKHEGFIIADSSPGRGTSFDIYLPVIGSRN